MFKTNYLRPANGLQNRNKMRTIKVVLLGEMSVGKSCLVNRLVKNNFHKMKNTIGGMYFYIFNYRLFVAYTYCWSLDKYSFSSAAFCTFTTQIGNMPVKMEIWDTAGQERFYGLVPMYYRHAQAAIIVYDITNRVGAE